MFFAYSLVLFSLNSNKRILGFCPIGNLIEMKMSDRLIAMFCLLKVCDALQLQEVTKLRKAFFFCR